MELVLDRVGGGVVNWALEKRERVTMRGKCSIRGEIGKVFGIVADVSNMDCLRKIYGAFGEWARQLEKWRHCW